ncbi:Ig-like domain-containing protein, partial [Shewanella sp. CAL98-MNA-CIBAN-0140]
NVWIEDKAGSVFDVPIKRISSNGGYYVYQWELKNLPEGSHDIVVAAKENHGPISKELAVTFSSDKSAPIVEINFSNN